MPRFLWPTYEATSASRHISTIGMRGHVDVPQERWPVANWLILLATVCVFLMQMPDLAQVYGRTNPLIYGLSKALPNVGTAGITNSLMLTGWGLKELFGHMWLHGGFFHLFGNMLFLWLFGNAVCPRLATSVICCCTSSWAWRPAPPTCCSPTAMPPMRLAGEDSSGLCLTHRLLRLAMPREPLSDPLLSLLSGRHIAFELGHVQLFGQLAETRSRRSARRIRS